MKHKSFSLPSWLLPLLLMLLGSTLRLACLGSVTGGIHQDESFVAWNAFDLLHEGMDSAGHVWPVYMADWSVCLTASWPPGVSFYLPSVPGIL